MTLVRPTPHRDKLRATLESGKLPSDDKPLITHALARHRTWISEMESVHADGGEPEDVVARLVRSLDEYKRFVDLEIIFDSRNDFLYRQKGQLKLDNSIIEEFLPWLISSTTLPGSNFDGLEVGPTKCYSALAFESSVARESDGAGMRIRTKDQDFALSRRLFLKASHHPDFSDAASAETRIAYIVTETKTNLDKTMFQEAVATARDLKIAVPASHYILMAEWLDMSPISTAPTDIERVLLLRGAKRLASNIRSHFSTAHGRQAKRDDYADYLAKHPFRQDVFRLWLSKVSGLLGDGPLEEADVLSDGYF